ncbi:hypothetical protein JO04_20090 [Salmonella enterica subsp. enterica serovar Give]|uniref:Uncharacterized protein n=1 Tax=Salmonella enterica subsp. enterica serovar Give TaxID=46626 RepID=A0A8E7KD00_SALET|nr:hypothetical protein [Salmonella enterica]EBU8924864.1 hypothetical protein [Salmonella enterica subsp. enterica serovar Nima]EBW2289744.1 hypothetical protein [Salmonella enterica subsp. enterica serovar Newport]EDS7029678.1 hypothetical protein [Salmonella enterica subsp. enterica]EEP8237737.1 hypothetical protein [Salmonella enterica subsp. enterica serovar Chester]EIR7526219.1 hypothetical protein [Salmonella enterica subsp. enterica serovar Brandenburg]
MKRHRILRTSVSVAGTVLKRCLACIETELRQLKKENRHLREQLKQPPMLDTEQPGTYEKQQTYVAGVMMGRDILSLQTANALSDIKTDNRILLAGIQGALSHQELLNENILLTALSQTEQSIRKEPILRL